MITLGACEQHMAHKCIFNHLWDFDNPLKAMTARDVMILNALISVLLC